MKSYIFPLIAGVFLFAGCETDSGGGASARGSERAIRIILDSRSQTVDALTKLDLPAGVDVEIKVE